MKFGKKIGLVVGGVSLLAAGCVCGYLYANRDLGIEGELSRTRQRLNRYYIGSQCEMTLLSGMQRDLASMELEHVRLAICNQSDYGKIEDVFLKDEAEWDKALTEEQKRASEFEGGSFAPMDCNMRLTAFLLERVHFLNTRWRK